MSSPIEHAGRRIDFASRPRVLAIAFALLWLSGWLLLLALMVLDYKRFGTVSLLWIAMLGVGGPPGALALLWAASGKRESLLLTPSEVRIDRWAGPIRLSRKFEPNTIKGLRVATVRPPWACRRDRAHNARHVQTGRTERSEPRRASGAP